MQKVNGIKDVVSFQIHRNIVNLYKRYFEITEDLLTEHKLFISKLQAKLQSPNPDIDLKELDYFTDEKFNQIRKKILDAGNDASRELEKALGFVDMNLKEEIQDEQAE
jgi:hypothetical protein